ncbi:hypothetical protein PTMSG1_04131 [Pyrenophora teres f. maculata]|nr:hypothetical protein PTMSG1_04131 [Pyrenophora teres f. maculata]
MYFSRATVLSAMMALAYAQEPAAAAAESAATPSMAAGMGGDMKGGMAGGEMMKGGKGGMNSTDMKGGMGGGAAGGAAAGGAAGAAAAGGAAAGMTKTHVVMVGGSNGSLVFLPADIQAAAGDLVQFQFYPKNHSVVQSTFDNPCVPIQNIMPNKTDAFFSGFMPTNASAAASKNLLTYTIRVPDTKPIWFYCSQAKHCQGGMVGAINAAKTGNKTLAAFAALAAKAPATLSPGMASGGAAGSGSAAGGNTPTSPSAGGGAAAGGAGGAAGGANGTSTASSGPAQATANVAAGGFNAQSFSGVFAALVAGFMVML